MSPSPQVVRQNGNARAREISNAYENQGTGRGCAVTAGVPMPGRLVASRIRGRLATDSLHPPLSASIGVAVYPQDGETIEALLRTADRELFEMKPV
jgi:GGDEF domain-containing protein